jgi:quercetin dioxygenase-like cupin family protein
VQVVRGRVTIEVSGERAECAAGTLVAFEPGERHSLDALEDCVLLLVLAPWPAREHYAAMEAAEPQHLPPNASVNPAVSTSAGD